jgi:hypothetical protein
MKFESIPLGPLILKTKISDDLLLTLRNHVDGLLTGPHSDYSAALAGKNKQQSVLEYDIVHGSGLDQVLLETGYEYLNRINVQENLKILAAWVNVCEFSSYNPIHLHDGIFSGILYLECPKSSLDMQNMQVPLTDGHTQFLFGQVLKYSNNLLTLYPEPGTLLLFPSWLMHVAYPSRSSLNRVTISFNLGN